MVDIEENKFSQAADEMPLSSFETDTIGEILNISMGAAATAVSTMVDRGVSITTPSVSMILASEFETATYEPAIGIEIQYLEGLNGANLLVMRQRDIRMIVNLLLGEESDPNSSEPLDEMHISAVSEIMNQMMGASSTALANFLGRSVNISPPEQFDLTDVQSKISKEGKYIVTVRFTLKIENLLDSEFVTVMPLSFTREIVSHAIRMNDPEPAEPVTAPAPPPVEKAAPQQAVRPPEPKPPRPAPQQYREPVRAQSPVSVKPLELTSFDDESPMLSIPGDQGNFKLIMGVPLEVTVEIGKTRMPVKDILDIRQGSLIELDKQASDPVDIIVNGKMIARGDVVIIDDDFGVRITEIISDRQEEEGE